MGKKIIRKIKSNFPRINRDFPVRYEGRTEDARVHQTVIPPERGETTDCRVRSPAGRRTVTFLVVRLERTPASTRTLVYRNVRTAR